MNTIVNERGVLAPRPVLVVAGGKDDIVLPEHSRTLFVAAHEPKSWLLVESAGHGRYASASSDYAKKLVAFYQRALLGPLDESVSRERSAA